LFIASLLALQPVSSWACAACYGASDAPMAQGMNWGIMSLLGIIGCVLMGVAGFFVYLVRRAARQSLLTAVAKSSSENSSAVASFASTQPQVS
jgi:hypothetical protein